MSAKTVRTTISLPKELAVSILPFKKAGTINVSALAADAIRAWLRKWEGIDPRTPIDEYSMTELTAELDRRAREIYGKPSREEVPAAPAIDQDLPTRLG